MSVVGIVILITLILILRLITQMTIAAPSGVDTSQLQSEIESLQQTLREIQDETAKLHKAKQDATIWIPEPADLETQQKQIDKLNADIADVETKITQAEQHCEALKQSPALKLLTEKTEHIKELQKEIKELQDKSAQLQKEEAALQVKLDALKAKHKELDKELAKSVSPQLKVKVPKQSDKQSYIVLYGSGKITVIPADGSAEQTFTGKNEFDRFVRSKDKRKEYFVMYIRPSRFDRYEEVLNELKRQGFDVGLQVIGEKTDFSIE
ncbi:hypothetical protein FACS189454_00700 [Planctomycetales bacterium]|nr:hypothetical protein FACS189454_00700 [Planctomycetales bacterium]